MNPALPTFRFKPAVPDDVQGLVAAIWKRDQVLLQWIKPEGVAYFAFLQFSLFIIGFYKELPVSFLKAAADSRVLELTAGKIPEHGFIGSGQHGLVVV